MSRPVPKKDFSLFAMEKKWQAHWNSLIPVIGNPASPPTQCTPITTAIHEDALYRHRLMRTSGFNFSASIPPLQGETVPADHNGRTRSLGGFLEKNIRVTGDIRFYSGIHEEFGSDVLRFSLVAQSSNPPDRSRLKGSAALLRKLWNAFRYSCIHLHGDEVGIPAPAEATDVDRWFLNRINTATARINDFFDHGILSSVSAHIERLIRHDFCGWYLEWIRGNMANSETRRCLRHSILQLSHLIHPLMPHISEEIHSRLATNGRSSLLLIPYPEFRSELVSPRSYKEIEALRELIRVTRRVGGIAARETIPIPNLTLQGNGSPSGQWLLSNKDYYLRLVGANSLKIQDKPPETAFKGEASGWTIWIPIQDPVTLTRILRQLRSRNESLSLRIHRMQRKLNDRNFMDGVSGNTSLRWKRQLQTQIHLKEQTTRLLTSLERQNGNYREAVSDEKEENEKN